MTFVDGIKEIVKKAPIVRATNAAFKCRQMKRKYDEQCKLYDTPSVIRDGDGVIAAARRLISKNQIMATAGNRVRRVIFVGTDWEQDRSGIVQGLQRHAEVLVFAHSPGTFGQRWPRGSWEFDEVRQHNGNELLRLVRFALAVGPLDAIVGQMWGISMDWRALSAIREIGIPIVNIGMDDRHAFRGQRLADGTWGGTLGLLPHLTLACTAAPECVAWYRREGCPAIFLPEGSDELIFGGAPVSKVCDVAFVGANYGPRSWIVDRLKRANIQVSAYGAGWPSGRIPTENMPALFRQARIVLGVGTIGFCSDFVGLKMRDFDAPMSGSLYLTTENPDLHALYDVGEEIVTYASVQEAIDKVIFYLKNDDQRERIARAGQMRAIREHTWADRFRWVLDSISLDKLRADSAGQA